MSNDQHSKRPRHRRGRWWRSWLKRLPRKLTSREFNIYQAVFAVMVTYLVFRVFILLFLNNQAPVPAPPPE